MIKKIHKISASYVRYNNHYYDHDYIVFNNIWSHMLNKTVLNCVIQFVPVV